MRNKSSTRRGSADHILTGARRGWLRWLAACLCVAAFSAAPVLASWEVTGPSGGDFLWAAVNPANALHVVAVVREHAGTHVYMTMNGGLSWSRIGALSTSEVFDADAHGLSMLYAVDGSTCFVSSTGGALWNEYDFPPVSGSVSLVRADPLDAGAIRAIGTIAVSGGAAVRHALTFSTSNDAGQTWTALRSTSFESLTPTDMAVSHSDPNVMYVCGHAREDSADKGVLLKSTDGGSIWLDISDTVDDTTTTLFNCLAVDPTDPDRVYLGAALFYRTTDGGTSWMRHNLTAARTIAIDPTDSAKVYVSGDDTISRTTNYGQSWRTVANGGHGAARRLVVAKASPSTLYGATSVSLLKSTDEGETWRTAHDGIYGSTVFAAALAPSQTRTIYAAVAGRRLLVSPDGGFTWVEAGPFPKGGQIHDLLVHAANPSAVLALGWDWSGGGGLFRSGNGGAAWLAVPTPLDGGLRLAQDPSSVNTVFLCGFARQEAIPTSAAHICRSVDGGTTWQDRILLDADSALCTALAVAPSNSSILYATTDQAAVWRSDDGGATWRSATGSLPDVMGKSYGNALWIAPYDADRVVLGATDGAFSTSDGGAAWRGPLLVGMVSRLAYYKPNNLLCASVPDRGVYLSDDSGQTWSDITQDLAGAEIGPLALDSNNGLLFAGAEGMSLWRYPLGAPREFQVFPGAGLLSSGLFGGPFDPTSVTYAVVNFAETPIEWKASHSRDWVDVSKASGTAAPGGGSDSFRVSLNARAAVLPIGTHVDTVTLTNPTTGHSETRTVSLNVMADFPKDNWEEIGPSGGEFWWVWIDPTNASRVLAATQSPGRLYRSEDGGATWVAGATLPESLNDLTASGFANLYGLVDKGCYLSTDAGASWAYAPFPEGSGRAKRIAAHPQNAGKVYAAGYNARLEARGLTFFACEDGGQDWSAWPVLDYHYAFDPLAMIVLNAENSTVFVAGRGDRDGASTRAFLRGVDDGSSWTWTNLSSQFETQDRFNIYSIVLDNANPSRLYASGQSYVYRSSDSGDTWEMAGPVPYGATIAGLAVNPLQTSTLVGAGLQPNNASTPIYQSLTYGGTWRMAGSVPGRGDRIVAGGGDSATVVIATTAGIYKSTDAGVTWVTSHEGIHAVRVPKVSVAASDPSTLYFLSNHQSAIRSRDSGETWEEPLTPPASQGVADILVSVSDPERLFLLEAGRPNYSARVFRTADGDLDWDEHALPYDYGACLAGSPTDGNLVYAGGRDILPYGSEWTQRFIVSRTTDGGATWPFQVTVQSTKASRNFSALAVAPGKPSIVYAAGESGLAPVVFRSGNSGTSWADVTNNLPGEMRSPGAVLSAIWIHPHNSNKVLLAVSEAGVIGSRNGGLTWEANELVEPTYDLAYHESRNMLYAATSNGAYASRNGGASWEWLGEKMPVRRVLSLAVDPENEYLFAGTDGGSVARLRLGSPRQLEVLPEEEFQTAGPAGGPFLPAGRTYTLANIGSGTLSWTAGNQPPWIALSTTSGTIGPHATTGVELATSEAAEALDAGSYSAWLTFRNVYTGREVSREVRLDVRPVSRFRWTNVPSPQESWAPFNVTLTALDSEDQTVGGFEGRTELGSLTGHEVAIGSGTKAWPYPLGTFYEDVRVQIIYLSNEIAAVGFSDGLVTALAFDVARTPAQSMQNYTIRLQHTQESSFHDLAWTDSGWTTVYQKDLNVLTVGWTVFEMSTPFQYNGVDHLLVDLSFNNASRSDEGEVRYSALGGAQRVLYVGSDSLHGDPLTWSGQDPQPRLTEKVPNVRLFISQIGPVAPGSTGAFVKGVWTGPVLLQQHGEDMRMYAVDADGNKGISNPVVVQPGSEPPLAVPGVWTQYE